MIGAELAQAGDHLPGRAARAGSNPVVGSSRKISSGFPTSAPVRRRSARWPPDSAAAAVGEVGEPDEVHHLAGPTRPA
jgi:hypothetical protein